MNTPSGALLVGRRIACYLAFMRHPKDQDPLARLEAEEERWRKEDLARAVAKSPLRRAEFHTDCGIPIPDLLTPADVGRPSAEDIEKYERDVGFPGRFPYTRGPQPTMYRGRLWTMRQFAGFGSPEDTNQRFKYLLEHGMTGLSTAFDMPALMGYDADHPMARGEVGREGVAVSTLKDFEILYSGIPLDRVTTSMTINATALFALCCYVAVAEKQGVSQDKLGGTIQNDVLKEYVAQKEWVVGPRPATRIVVDMIEYTAKHMPRWHPVSISGYHIREAGATAVQEMAFTLADGFGYVEECVKRGMDVDDFAARLSFFWDVHNDFFEEIAKFRAARRTYARPTEDAVRLALRTQQLIAYESGVDRVVDPLAGSYYVEYLTDEMEKRALQILDKVAQLGGIIRAIEEGYPQREIAESAYQFQREVESGERKIVGVNSFKSEQEEPISLLKIDEKVAHNQIERLQAVKRSRSQAAVQEKLRAVEAACRDERKNLMVAVLDAVKAYCTLGEVSDVFRKVWGAYREGQLLRL